MTKKSGIWVDSKKAVVVQLNEKDRTFKVVESGIEGRTRTSGEGKKFGRFARQFLTFEKRSQRKKTEAEKRFFKSILDALDGNEEVVLFGPSSTKTRLEKEFQNEKSKHFKVVGTENSDNMTDNQIGAWVESYFQKHK